MKCSICNKYESRPETSQFDEVKNNYSICIWCEGLNQVGVSAVKEKNINPILFCSNIPNDISIDELINTKCIASRDLIKSSFHDKINILKMIIKIDKYIDIIIEEPLQKKET